MEEIQPRIQIEPGSQGECVTLYGSWNAAILALPANWRPIAAALDRKAKEAMEISWDLRQVERLDHTGAQMLWNAWGQRWPKHVLLLDVQRTTLSRVEAFTVPAPIPVKPRRGEWLAQLGQWWLASAAQLKDATALMGQLLLDVLQMLRRPDRAPWHDISVHIYRIGAMALPITALVGFLIGVVLAYLMALQLRQLGASIYVVNILGGGLIRELGPVLTAILIAGRSGSAITAQIGAMQVTEELDAMRVMGISPSARLVLPRAIALSLVMPMLAVWTIAAALVGGMLVCDAALGLSPGYFFHALPKAVHLGSLYLSLAKSVVFGWGVALIGCHFGLRVRSDTQSLGEGTTASVVMCITMVLCVDAIFAIAFRGVGL